MQMTLLDSKTNYKLKKMKLGRRASYLRRCIRVTELLSLHETNTSIRCRIFENWELVSLYRY
jgi:hypothetical protein